jgi:hypothetical protein
MINAVREERTGEDLMDPRDFRIIVEKIQTKWRVPVRDASIALDQAIAFVVMVAQRFEVAAERIWPSQLVDDAWRVWLENPLQYSKIAPDAGAHVHRIQRHDRATPGDVLRSAELIEDAGFALHREAWHGQAGARSIGVVRARLLREQASA